MLALANASYHIRACQPVFVWRGWQQAATMLLPCMPAYHTLRSRQGPHATSLAQPALTAAACVLCHVLFSAVGSCLSQEAAAV
jgi:hypothetical protein